MIKFRKRSFEKKFIAFFENDLNIQQQKIIINEIAELRMIAENHDKKTECKSRYIYILIKVNNIR